MDLTMMERVGDRWEKMEGSCSTGQSPQQAVLPVEEEEEEEVIVQIMKLLIIPPPSVPVPFTSSLLGPDILLSTLLSKTLSLSFFT
jgi:hypothetical protein